MSDLETLLAEFQTGINRLTARLDRMEARLQRIDPDADLDEPLGPDCQLDDLDCENCQ